MSRIILVASLVTLLAAPRVVAQGPGGRIHGTARDESGGVLPGALVDLDGPAVRSTATAADGTFAFDGLPAGRYRVAVRLPDFAPWERSGLVLPPDGNTQVEAVLAVASPVEQVVVTASRVETARVDAPATITSISSQDILASPAQSYGELLRSVPGVNVVQTSARDVNLTARQATSTLANSQLALLDGRSIYLDFFGLVLWDLLPVNPSEIARIEVVNGPASAVWGANAMTGVVNIITRPPRETQGLAALLESGWFGRSCPRCSRTGQGWAYGASLAWSDAPSDRLAYRVSAGWRGSEPWSRPTGRIPVIADPRVEGATCDPGTGRGQCVGGAAYPADHAPGPGELGSAFENAGTSQPRLDLRLDQELGQAGRLAWSAGYAGTAGIIHTGIGPFEIQDGSHMGYGRVAWTRGAARLAAFVNLVDLAAPNLISIDPSTGGPVQLDFTSQTWDLEGSYALALGRRQALSLGGNLRRNVFDITLAPNAEDRTEAGLYAQDELFAGPFRLLAGARADHFGNLDHWVFSPRLAVLYKPAPAHAVRLAWNRAFRSASAVANSLEQEIVQPAPLPTGGSFPLVVRAVGSDVPIEGHERPALHEELMTAWELGYTGTFGGRTTVGLALYVNDLDDNINFSRLPNDYDPYTAANPPPGWPLPPQVLTLLASRGIYYPRTAYTYKNLGPLRQRGIELSLEQAFGRALTAWANYSWQDDPQALPAAPGQEPFPPGELSPPPHHRFNAGLSWNGRRGFASLSLSYTDRIFWSDVLTDPYAGWTDSFARLDGSLGWRWAGGRVTAALKGNNLLNAEIQQHVYGDISRRALSLELRLSP